MRDPWEIVDYKGKWNKNDENWTDDIIKSAQLPYGIDPRISSSKGLFIMDK
jgi:hypothetical protein